jgi:hypothetical protein
MFSNQLWQRSNGLSNAISHSLNEEGVEGLKDWICELISAQCNSNSTLAFGKFLEENLNFLRSHLELLIMAMLDAFL